MAGTITIALRTAQSGILAQQAAIDATANNIANVNTTGYSRKLVNMEQRVLAGVGAGVQLSDFTRAIDEGLLKDMRKELSDTNELDAQTTYFDRLQSMFGSPESNTSLSHILTQLSQASESLAAAPDQALNQQEFVRWANEVALQFQSLTGEIQSLRAEADKNISSTVDQINQLTSSIASLNDKIIRNQAISHDVTDLEDQRDTALNELSKLIDITYYQRGNGDYVVFTQNGQTLVDRTAKTITHTATSMVSAGTTYAEGDINGIYVGEQVAANDITDSILGGSMAGLIAQRDSVLPGLQSEIDQLASQLTSVMNQISNRGSNYPGISSLTGTRSFIDSANQQIQLDAANGSDDVTIALFNSSGEQQASTTLNTIMTSGAYGSGVQTDHGFWSIDEVASTIQDWLRDNGASTASVSVNANNKFQIDLNSSTLSVAFRDQTASANGSDQDDASISFDSDGDGDADQTYTGFCNFLGLNDLFVNDNTDQAYESQTVATSWTSSAGTLTFYDSAAGVGSGNALGSVSISAASSLSDIVDSINDADIGIVAAVVPDGSGSRLRLTDNNGREMVITQGASDTILTDLGLAPTTNGLAAGMNIRSDIMATPSLLSTGQMQWDSDNSVYYTSAGDSSNAQQMAEAMTSKTSFDSSGGLLSRNATFAEYSTAIISGNSTLASTNASQLDTQQSLSDSLQLKAQTFSGVNMDEEMSNLILYQQAYSASARVISVIQQLFQTLNDIIK